MDNITRCIVVAVIIISQVGIIIIIFHSNSSIIGTAAVAVSREQLFEYSYCILDLLFVGLDICILQYFIFILEGFYFLILRILRLRKDLLKTINQDINKRYIDIYISVDRGRVIYYMYISVVFLGLLKSLSCLYCPLLLLFQLILHLFRFRNQYLFELYED